MTSRPLITLSTLLLVCFSALAQDTTWYDRDWKIISSSADARFFRTTHKTDSGWLVTDHYRNGQAQMTGRYSDDSLKVAQGTFKWFFEDGTIYHSLTYSDNKINGLEQEFYENGNLKLKGISVDKHKEGEWTAYFPSGKPAGKAMYHNDKRVSQILYHENGSRNTKDTILYRDSDYPGGPSRYLYFLNKNLRYPDSAVIHEIQGTVVVRIHLSKEGKVSHLQIERSVDPYLDAEALRVMKLMADWEPAIVAGVPVESYQLQPVIFKL